MIRMQDQRTKIREVKINEKGHEREAGL